MGAQERQDWDSDQVGEHLLKLEKLAGSDRVQRALERHKRRRRDKAQAEEITANATANAGSDFDVHGGFRFKGKAKVGAVVAVAGLTFAAIVWGIKTIVGLFQ